MDGITGWSPVLEDQAAADPALDRHHLDPDLRRQLQRLRPDLRQPGRARRPELRHRHPRHLPLPHLLRLPAAARRPAHGRDDRHRDVPHHPGRRLDLPLRHPDAAAPLPVLRRDPCPRPAPPPRAPLAAHGILILYTLIALFPVFVVVVNSFKARRAIFNAPLALPGPETFDLDRLHHRAEPGRLPALLPEQPDRHRRLARSACCSSARWPPSRSPNTASAATR